MDYEDQVHLLHRFMGVIMPSNIEEVLLKHVGLLSIVVVLLHHLYLARKVS